MTTIPDYADALQQFRLNYFLPLVLACNGNVCEASRQCGVHRNTITRCLNRSGYDSQRVREMVTATQEEVC